MVLKKYCCKIARAKKMNFKPHQKHKASTSCQRDVSAKRICIFIIKLTRFTLLVLRNVFLKTQRTFFLDSLTFTILLIYQRSIATVVLLFVLLPSIYSAVDCEYSCSVQLWRLLLYGFELSRKRTNIWNNMQIYTTPIRLFDLYMYS